MDIIQVNVLNPQPLQAALTLLSAVFGGAVHLKGTHNLLYAELCGQENVRAALRVQREPFADYVFRLGVCVGGIPVPVADFPGMVKKLEELFLGSTLS